MSTEIETTADTTDVAGKYLIFRLAEEEYAIPILKVKEIIGMMGVTTVPRMPKFLRGVINLRGKIIPVVDLRVKFDMPEAEVTDETCIIVVEVECGEMGIIVDSVSEVEDIRADEVEEAPSFAVAVSTEFLLGIGTSNGRVQLLVDIERVLSRREIETLASVRGDESTTPSKTDGAR